MKFKLKHVAYILNDITNTMLKKERIKDQEIIDKYRIALIIISIIAIISVLINLLLIFR